MTREQLEIGQESILKYYKISDQLEVTQESSFVLSKNVDVALAAENITHVYILLKDVENKYSVTLLNKETGIFTSSNITFQQSVEIEQMLATEG